MKVGILTYHKSCNFGANLQAYSTYRYLEKHGCTPIIIDYFPDSLLSFGKKLTHDQQHAHYDFFFKERCNITQTCKDAKSVATQIAKHGIERVIIGSDAVFNICPNLKRIVLSRRGIKFITPIETIRFPNPFWGEFNQFLRTPVDIFVYSASSQNAVYQRLMPTTKRKMETALLQTKYLSVRDDWTRNMVSTLTGGKIIPQITPDPVFAFNDNVLNIPSEEEISQKFEINKGKYILLGFRKIPSKKWLDELCSKIELHGYEPLMLPMPDILPNTQSKLYKTISPLEWYSIIKHAKAYIGNNMHPIVIALHNCVPFFSFDQYGILRPPFKGNETASKTYNILKKADMLSLRTCAMPLQTKLPSPDDILDKLMAFDFDKGQRFANAQLLHYRSAMDDILRIMGSSK